MLKSALLVLSALFATQSSYAFTLLDWHKCPPGWTSSVENDHRGKPKKVCCVKNDDHGGGDNGGGENNGGSCNGGGNNGGGHNGGGCNGGGNNGGGNGHHRCVEIPNCKVEPGPGATLATANNSNSKCRKTDPSDSIITGATCPGTWNIQNGKCCLPTR